MQMTLQTVTKFVLKNKIKQEKKSKEKLLHSECNQGITIINQLHWIEISGIMSYLSSINNT